MNKLTRNIITFLVTFLAVHVCSMYIVGGFYLQTVESKLIATFLATVLGMAALSIINGPE